MDEGVKIPLSMDNSSLAGQVAQAGNIIKSGLEAAGAGAAKSFDPVIEELNRLRSELAVTGEGAAKLMAELNASQAAAAKAASEASTGFQTAASGAEHLVNKLLAIVAAYVSIEGTFKLLGASLNMADRVQDTARALETFTGSAEKGAAAMAVFEAAQEHTRSTALELAHLYTDILPLGIARGWSQAKLADITVQLDQLAAKAMMAPDALIAGFNRLLAGGAAGAGRNPLLRVLGLDSNQLQEILKTGGDLGQKLAEKIAEHAGDVADSWHSALNKVKEETLQALGTGLMESFGQGSEALKGFKDALTDPELLKSLKDIGTLAGEGLAVAIEALKDFVSGLNALKNFVFAPYHPPGYEDIRPEIYTPRDPRASEKGVAVPSYDALENRVPSLTSGSGIGDAGKEQADKTADAAAQAAEMIAKANKEATDAELAFHKLFDPEPPTAWLKKIQETEQATKAFQAGLAERADAAEAALLKPGITAGAKEALNAEIQRLGDLAAATDEASAAKIQLDIAMDNSKELEKASATVLKVSDDFKNFAAGLQLDPSEVDLLPEGAVSKFNSKLAGITADFREAMAEATRPPILQPDPETISQILTKFKDMGRKAGAEFHDQVEAANKKFEIQVDEIFKGAAQNKDPFSGMVDFAAVGAEIAKTFNADVQAGDQINRQKLDAAFKKAGDMAAAQLAAALDKFGNDFADVLTGALEGGASGFASAASKLFLEGVHKGAAGLGKLFGSLVSDAFGAPPVRREGESAEDFKVRQLNVSNQQTAILQGVQVAVGAVGQAMQIFANAKQGQAPNVLATTASFALAGSTFGWIGAAVGAVVGAIIGILGVAKAKAEQLFATYGVRDGKPYVEPYQDMYKQFLNLPSSQYHDMINQIQKTLETTQNDYIKIMGRFGQDVADGVSAEVTKANFQPQLMNSKTGIKNFMQDFQYWVENTLPAEIVGHFKEPLKLGLEDLGLSAQRFEEIWTRLLAIDPSEAAKSWNELIDALTAFQTVSRAWSPDQFGITVGLFTKTREDMNRSFADSLAQTDIGLVQMGDTMSHLFGPEQITAAKDWGDALLQREAAVKQFFQQVAQAIDSVIAGYQSKIRDLTLAGMTKTDEAGNVTPDVAAQVDYLKKYADSLWSQITKATTPEQVMQLSNELSNTISKIQQIGGAQSADAAEAYRVWAIQQLAAAQDLVVGQLNKLAQDVAEQNAAFIDAIQGFIDAFLKATDEITGHTGDGTGDAGTPPGTTPPDTGRPGHQDPRTLPPPALPPGHGTGGAGGPGGRSHDIIWNQNPKFDPDRNIFSGAGGGEYNDPYFNWNDIASTRPPAEPPLGQGYMPAAQASYMQAPPTPPAADGGSVPSGRVMQEWIRGLDANGSLTKQWVERFAAASEKQVAMTREQSENSRADADTVRLFVQAVADFRATVDAGLHGEIGLVVDGEPTDATVPIDDGGFDRRTVGARGPR